MENLVKTEIRPLRLEDIPDVILRMKECKARFLRLGSPKMYKAICKDALSLDKVIITVARNGKDILGYLVIIIDYARYKRNFIFCHPLLGLIIALKKLQKSFCDMINFIRIIQKKSLNCEKPAEMMLKEEPYRHWITPVSTNRSWNDDSPNIAKLVHIGVSKKARGKKIGRKIVLNAFDLLKKRGVPRTDGTVDRNNLPGIRMHSNLGWTFSEAEHHLFLSIDL